MTTAVRLALALVAGALLVFGATRISGLSPPTPAAAKPQPVVVAVPRRAVPAPVAKPAPPADGPFVVKRILELDGPLRHGDWTWDDKGVPAGPLVVTVDLAAQTISVFRDGWEIGTAAVLYGADDKPTPLGAFPILQKDRDHVSNLYDAPMPYMLRLTNDGVAIHGSTVKLNYATHGCIGVPNAFAAKLFATAKLGDRVLITNGKMLKMGEAITRT